MISERVMINKRERERRGEETYDNIIRISVYILKPISKSSKNYYNVDLSKCGMPNKTDDKMIRILFSFWNPFHNNVDFPKYEMPNRTHYAQKRHSSQIIITFTFCIIIQTAVIASPKRILLIQGVTKRIWLNF